MTNHDPADRLLSSTEAGKILGVSRQTVIRRLTPVMTTPGGKRFYTLRSIREQLNDGAAA